MVNECSPLLICYQRRTDLQLAMVQRLLFILLLTLFSCAHSSAQESKPKQDSLSYNSFEKFLQRTKFKRFLSHSIFKAIVPKANRQTKRGKTIKAKPFIKTEGKIVRAIHIITQDPFGYHIQDTTLVPHNSIVKAANTLHLKTRPGIIENLLLFKKNEPFDSLLVLESERLIRSQTYVHNVQLYTLSTSPKADSVDVYMRVWDVWSIVPTYKRSASITDVSLTDINFLGLGQSLQAGMQWNNPEKSNSTRLNYLIPNISNTYISSNLQYSFSGEKDLIKSVEFSRLFYSPLTKWAGGIYLGQTITNQGYFRLDTIHNLSNKTNIQDIWGARSWQLFKGNSEEARTTKFILSGRMLFTNYPGRVPEADSATIFNKENIYFAGIGITSRKYIQDRYIFNYGKVEDVPIGWALGTTIGIDVQQKDRWYWGMKASWGNYFPYGYMSTHFEYETYMVAKGFKQGVITARINYFTRLFKLGNWKIRQFIKPTLIYGINRLPSDNITFSQEMKGFEGITFPATQMLAMTLQTQSYAPWNLIGFRFGPYLFTSFGMLGNESSGFSINRLYSILGAGLLIKNDFLMINSFQISIAFYPSIPNEGYNIFKTNAYKTSDYSFRDFEISKPGNVDYR